MPRVLWIALPLLWGAAAACWLWNGLEYESTSASVKTPPEQWPITCTIARDPQRPTLLVFVHPKCPCTRATVRELDRLIAQHRGRVAVQVIVWKPAGVSQEWEQTDLLAQIAALPDTSTVFDQDGTCQELFRATTSGECLLFNESGRLVFHGGITALRGHEGPSIGQAALAALLTKTNPSIHSAPVFGCALESTADNQQASP